MDDGAVSQITMTQAQYADHRGVSKQFINKIYHQGRLKTDDAGQILVAESDAELDANKITDDTDAPTNFSQSQARKADAAANLAELKYDREIGKLLDKDEAARFALDLFGDLKDALVTQLPPKIAPILAAKTSEREVLWALRGALEDELAAFAKRLEENYAPDGPMTTDVPEI